MIKKRCVLSIAAMALAIPFALGTGTFADESREPLKIEGKETLFLRVLSKPFAKIYQSADLSSPTVAENLPAMQPYFVYEEKAPASDLESYRWYKVGTDAKGTTLGWITSDDAVKWKQTLCLSFTHPLGRNQVMMFEKKDQLDALVRMPVEQRQAKTQEYYTQINSGNISNDFPVLSVEPKKAIDITQQFYLLPILEYDQFEIDNREGRLLKLAAVTRQSADAREKSDIRSNEDYREHAVSESTAIDASTLEKLNIDVVWAMDTTNSMMPYIEQTLKVVQQVSDNIASKPELANKIHFGIWGYRDSMDIPGIGYNVQNYTPVLQTPPDFVNTLKEVSVTKVGSEGFDEDMFSGIHSALTETTWSDNSIRLIILAGDAPGHTLGHKWNATGQDQNTLRKIANDLSTYIFALHIQEPKAEQFNPLAEEQFKTLSTNEGMKAETFYALPAQEVEGFGEATDGITQQIIGLLEQKQQEKTTLEQKESQATADTSMQNAATEIETVSAPPVSDFAVTLPSTESSENKTSETEKAKQITGQTLQAAYVEWVGSQTKAEPPRDIVAWVTDKDLIDPSIQALEVRFLINKRQLDSLKKTLQGILSAGREGKIGSDDFFSALQAASALTARDPDMINNANSLAETGMVPEFLEDLPYTSRIMDMNSDLWNSWSIDEQDMFLQDLDARIMAYETIHDSPENWIQLNRSDDPSEYVYPIPLELLP
ncbi:hypothetical protein [Desulfogranum japonicum]|uniref:hypothetical protein n=1 Tax=Desulfogranum japonicum TaxID=231447 RepID=UPI00041DDADA|nr:hypothetical protein [Desulfogranum japonicum]